MKPVSVWTRGTHSGVGWNRFHCVVWTGLCEAFRSLDISFTPKSTAFTFHGMLSRSVTSVQCLDYHYYNCLYKNNSYNLKFDACADYVWQCSITMRIMEGLMQRQRQERKNIQFRTPSTKLEATEKLLKSVHMVSCSYCVQVIIIATTT